MPPAGGCPRSRRAAAPALSAAAGRAPGSRSAAALQGGPLAPGGGRCAGGMPFGYLLKKERKNICSAPSPSSPGSGSPAEPRRRRGLPSPPLTVCTFPSQAGKLVLAGAGTGGGLEPPEAKFCDTPTLGTIAVSALQNFVSGGGGGPGASGGHVTAGMASPGAAERPNLRCSLGIKSVLSWPPALKFCWVSFFFLFQGKNSATSGY